MFYGLLRDHDLTRILQHKAIVALSIGGDNEDGGGGDDQPSTSKNRKKLKKDFFNQRQSKASLKVDPNSPAITRIPIPELREHERMDLINTFQGKNIDYHTFLNKAHEFDSIQKRYTSNVDSK
jgi:hypothetical protein